MINSWKKAGMASVVVGMFVASAAFAGNQLHFKAGKFDPNDLGQVSEIIKPHATQARATQYHVIQFESAIEEADKEYLRSQGVEVLSYVPDNALLVKATQDEIRFAQLNSSRVSATVPYVASLRLSGNFPIRSVFNKASEVVALVKGVSEKAADEARKAMEKLPDVQVLPGDGLVFKVRVTLGALDQLAGVEGVEFVEPYQEMKIQTLPIETYADPSQGATPAAITGFETGTKIMNFEAAWNRGLTGKGQVASMADTGLDTGEKNTLFADFNNFKAGHIFGAYSKSWGDPMGHGTHVAGSIVSSGKGSTNNFKGGAPEAEFVAQGMWSPMLNNLTVPPKVHTLFEKAYAAGARIHSNSWGGAQNLGAYDNFASLVDKYMWENPDMLVIFAAGNSGVDNNKDGRIDGGSISSPGTAKNVLTVGASENLLLTGGIQRQLGDLLNGKPWGVEPLKSDKLSDDPNGIAAFSGRGPTRDGRLKPDIVAPGTNIVSNCSHDQGANPLWGKFDNDYCYSGGTSMSTPLTAGAATLVRQMLVEKLNHVKPSSALIKAVLMHSADDLFPGQYGQVGKARGQELLKEGPNMDQGYGRVNVDRATKVSEFLAIKDDVNGVGQGSAFTFTLTKNVPSSLKVTLMYTDAPGTTSAAKALVNDLDLKVTLGSGQVAQSQSKVNNHEQVVLANVNPNDNVTIEVTGANVPSGKNGKQPFAIVVSR